MLLMLCPGPDLFTIVAALFVICGVPLAIVGIVGALILSHTNARQAERTPAQPLGLDHLPK
jgi:predicted outer membrane lipoprotein